MWLKPTAAIQNGILVFDGRFRVARASALSHMQRAGNLMRAGRPDQGLVEAQTAVDVDPGFFGAQQALGDALVRLQRRDEARVAWQRALELAKKLEPGVRDDRIHGIERRLAGR
jgi:predicted RNA polymerase sigma factor